MPKIDTQAEKLPKWRVINRSRYQDRRPFDIREEAFAKAWENENEPVRGYNHGHGILQDLFIETASRGCGFFGRRMTHRITKRERMIVATVIQWLGTNCGWCWLNETLKKCGFKIVRIKDEE